MSKIKKFIDKLIVRNLNADKIAKYVTLYMREHNLESLAIHGLSKKRNWYYEGTIIKKF